MGSPGELLGSYFAHSSQPTLQLCLLFSVWTGSFSGRSWLTIRQSLWMNYPTYLD